MDVIVIFAVAMMILLIIGGVQQIYEVYKQINFVPDNGMLLTENDNGKVTLHYDSKAIEDFAKQSEKKKTVVRYRYDILQCSIKLCLGIMGISVALMIGDLLV